MTKFIIEKDFSYTHNDRFFQTVECDNIDDALAMAKTFADELSQMLISEWSDNANSWPGDATIARAINPETGEIKAIAGKLQWADNPNFSPEKYAQF